MKTITRLNNHEPVSHTGSGVPVYLYEVDGREIRATKVGIREYHIWNTEEEVNLIEE